MRPIETIPLLKKIYPHITEFLKFRWFFVSILLGFITSWFMKDSITPLLFWGKYFDERSLLYQVLILAIYVFFASAIFFCALIIISLLFSRRLNWVGQKLHGVFANLKLPGMQLFHKMMAGFKYGYKEIVYTLQVFTVTKENVHSFFSSPYRIVLIVIFTILFLPHAFILVDNIRLIIAYEVDAGMMMSAMANLFKNFYNMNVEFGSRGYGWTYFSINFFLLIPIYIAMSLKLIQGTVYLFIGIRLIFFIIGLGSVLAFHEVANRALRHRFFSFIAALLLIANPLMFRYFFFIHPETTGLLFLFLGILCLFRFHEERAKDYRWYTIGLVCLVLSALSKQIFFFTALPVLFLFVYLYCFHQEITIYGFLRSRVFFIAFLKTTIMSLLVFFVIHPYAFLQPTVLISANQWLLSAHSSLPMQAALKLWVSKIVTIPIIITSILACPITLGALYMQNIYKPNKMLYLVNLLGSCIILLFICMTARLFIAPSYLIPVYPFFILNVLSVLLYIIRKVSLLPVLKYILIVTISWSLLFILVTDFSQSAPMGNTRLRFRDSTVYKVYVWIDNNIPDNSRIANDITVTVPDGKGITSCNYWGEQCGTDYIEEYNPDYVIYDEDYRTSDAGTIRLKEYITDHDLKLIAIIDNTVEVYKKDE